MAASSGRNKKAEKGEDPQHICVQCAAAKWLGADDSNPKYLMSLRSMWFTCACRTHLASSETVKIALNWWFPPQSSAGFLVGVFSLFQFGVAWWIQSISCRPSWTKMLKETGKSSQVIWAHTAEQAWSFIASQHLQYLTCLNLKHCLICHLVGV